MGTTFKYIADDLLGDMPVGKCPSCSDVTVLYPMEAEVDNDEWSYTSDCVEELCCKCIRTLPLRCLRIRDQETCIQGYVNAMYPKGTLNQAMRLAKLINLSDELRRTPALPLFLQHEDWPFLDGDFCEFIGVPDTYEASIEIGQTWRMWNSKPVSYSDIYGEMTLEPESLNEVSKFRSLKTGALVFTWQMT